MLRRPLSLPNPTEVRYLASLIAEAEAPPGTPPGAHRLEVAAVEHRVGALLLEAHERERVRLPPSTVRRLEVRRALDSLQTSLLRRELVAVEPVVREACGVRPVLIKGPAVSDRLYSDPRLRPYSDLDLVVPSDRLGAAARALRGQLGYEPVAEPWPGFGERQGHHVGMLRRLGACSIFVELHWRLVDDPAARRLDHARLLARSERMALAGGGEIAIPSTEDDLVVLTLHLLHERPKRLRWINDVALAARGASEAQWVAAFEAARDLGLQWVLDRGLDYAADYLALQRTRPWGPGKPPPWGPLRAGERFDGWLGVQVGRLALGGWRERNGYLRSATRARWAQLGHRLGRRRAAP